MLSSANVIAATALVFGIGGVLFIASPVAPPEGGVPGAAQEGSPAASVSPSPSPTTTPEQSGPAGPRPLEPGAYSPGFWPSLTMTLPEGWLDDGSSDMFVGLLPAEQGVYRFLNVFRNMPIASGDCAEAPEPGVGPTAAEVIGALADRPGLDASEPVPVTIGGLSGLQLDFAVAEEWTGTCPGIGSPWVPLVYMPDFVYWGAEPGERFRIIVLDVAPLPSGMVATVMVFIYAADAAPWDEHLAASMEVVDSFEFTVDTPPLAGPPVDASEEEAGSMPPVEFSGQVSCAPPVAPDRSGTYETLPVGGGPMALTRYRDGAWPHIATMSDPRLEGDWYRTWEYDAYRAAGSETGLALVVDTLRIENGEGAWEGSRVGAELEDEDGTPATSGPMVLVGEGAYAGLTAYLTVLPSEDVGCIVQTRGVIFDGAPEVEPYRPE